MPSLFPLIPLNNLLHKKCFYVTHVTGVFETLLPLQEEGCRLWRDRGSTSASRCGNPCGPAEWGEPRLCIQAALPSLHHPWHFFPLPAAFRRKRVNQACSLLGVLKFQTLQAVLLNIQGQNLQPRVGISKIFITSKVIPPSRAPEEPQDWPRSPLHLSPKMYFRNILAVRSKCHSFYTCNLNHTGLLGTVMCMHPMVKAML